jgi:hypothetical protein
MTGKVRFSLVQIGKYFHDVPFIFQLIIAGSNPLLETAHAATETCHVASKEYL